MTVFETLASLGIPRCFLFQDEPSGLLAVIVLDDLRLGPAAGGIRTRAYPSFEAAVEDAAGLARAMTLKCALAGIDAGGGKGVVIDHPGLDRGAAFEILGQRIDELGGIFRTAGDLGTTDADLAAMARSTGYVHTETPQLAAAVADGVLGCLRAAVRVSRGLSEDAGVDTGGLRVAIQGCGAIGAAVARGMVAAGADVLVADVDHDRARALADEVGATVALPEQVVTAEVDVLCPCAVGGVLDAATATEVRAFAVVGGANRIFVDDEAEAEAVARGILCVPDPISSAGAVIEGIGRSVMGLDDRQPLIEQLGTTAHRVLTAARREGDLPSVVARRTAAERLAAADRTPAADC